MIVPDKILRSQRKTLAISVDATGKLIVRAPLRCSEARILAFIEKKSEWILKQKSKASAAAAFMPTAELDGFKFAFLGDLIEIRKFDGKKTDYDELSGTLFLPRNAGEERVKSWLKRQAKEIFSSMVARRAKEMGAAYKKVAVSSAKGRWGSCAADNTLRFTFRLVYAPTAVIDYVIVHELAHTFHKNHGKLFWNTVEKYCPDWKIKRRWLKDHRYLMQIF